MQTYPAFDVLVVDSAPSDPVSDLCFRRGIAYSREPTPGLSRARNVGARMAGGELIAYIDDDAVPEPEWLEALARGFDDPDVAAVTGRIRFMRGIGDSGQMSDEEVRVESSGRDSGTLDNRSRDWFARACFGGIGSNMAFRRSHVAGRDVFDERLGRGCTLYQGEDHLAVVTLVGSGLRTSHRSDAVVRHPFPATATQVRHYRLFNLRAAIAYILFLWAEFPSHRVELVRFLSRTVFKRMASGERRPLQEQPRRIEWLRAALGGPMLYRKARREWT